MTLEDKGYACMEAANGADALDLLRRKRAGLILLDLAMPVMNGRTFHRRFQLDGQNDGTPVIIISATGARRAQRELGAAGAIERPSIWKRSSARSDDWRGR